MGYVLLNLISFFFLNNSSIEIQLTYYKDYHFKVYKSLVVSHKIVCFCHHYLILEYFHHPEKKPHAH